MYFPVNFTKFLRTPFLTEHLGWLLLSIDIRFPALFHVIHMPDVDTRKTCFYLLYDNIFTDKNVYFFWQTPKYVTD